MARDHGGGVDAAVAHWGGERADWLDLSTGINPVPYPVGTISDRAWTSLPDTGAVNRLKAAARSFWQVPQELDILLANGASALIARMPQLTTHKTAYIPQPTYNEHAAAFDMAGYSLTSEGAVHVYVHPNNPDGRLWGPEIFEPRPLTIIDESFGEVTPEASHLGRAVHDGVLVLKSFGKFWGLAGLRLGFVIGKPDLLARIARLQEPWSVNGPALEIGARALLDHAWAAQTRIRLAQDAARLDALMTARGATVVGGTTLFRLYQVDDAAAWQDRLARGHVWSRIFPYSTTWLRLGLPAPDRWSQLEAAL